MDIASVIGVLVALTCLGFVGFEASHGNWAMFYSQEGFVMVFGGSISVVFMAMPLSSLKCAGGWMKRFMLHRGSKPEDVAKMFSRFADKSRREGILALEPEYAAVKDSDPFLASALRMTIDGMSAEVLERTLRLEIMAMQQRHKAGKKFFDLIKLYGPGWGLAATLVGQVGMFGNLADADIGKMGHMLAVAVVATMYGAILANGIAGPIGDKLAMRSAEEIVNREMMVQGILSIMGGDNPRVTLEKILAFVPRTTRSRLQAA